MMASSAVSAWSLSAHRGVCAAPRGPGTTDSSFSGYNPTGRNNPGEPSIRAYGYNNQYIAFYTGGGFIYDLLTKQLMQHTLAPSCGYVDLRNDTLYLLDATRAIVRWHGGTAQVGTWRSKVFGLPKKTRRLPSAQAYIFVPQMYACADRLLTDSNAPQQPPLL